ncbi:MAG: discoidin domain-containing protein, partial [Planctomycetaceae bacterium]|nr:discoidin domain-containing protein [Planctomycetaceae bacterium]
MKTLFYCFFSVLTVYFCFADSVLAAEPVKKTVEVIVLADSDDTGFEPYRAMDGNKQTMWHSEWRTAAPALPHTLVVDLQDVLELNGFVVTARNEGFNGDVKNYEVFITDNTDVPGEPVVVGMFGKGEAPNKKTPNRIDFTEPKKGRYFILKTLSNHSGGPYASVAELELLCDSATFKAKKITKSEL